MKTYFELEGFFTLTDQKPFVMAGPCILESDETNRKIAQAAKEAAKNQGFDYIFKASFDKANRTSADSFRGEGMQEGLQKLLSIKQEFGLPIVTDIHESYQAQEAAKVADILQIPAFLCRQTDLLLEAGKTNRAVNVKKAQFLSAADMKNVLKKLESTGSKKLMLTERGTMFGYNNLVVDFRGVMDMKEYGYPVIMDATHSTQRPGGLGSASGGDPKYAPYLAQCAALCGADGFFFEIHPNPPEALSDAATMIKLDEFERVLCDVRKAWELAKQ